MSSSSSMRDRVRRRRPSPEGRTRFAAAFRKGLNEPAQTPQRGFEGTSLLPGGGRTAWLWCGRCRRQHGEESHSVAGVDRLMRLP